MDTTGMRLIEGVWFDPRDGKTYFARNEGDPLEFTGFTFEDAFWVGPRWATPLIGVFNFWGNSVSGKLNPLGFATAETAEKVLRYCRDWAPELDVWLDDGSDRNKVVGPFSRTIERNIVATATEMLASETFSAGRLAVSIFRNGPTHARIQWRAELRNAGVLPR